MLRVHKIKLNPDQEQEIYFRKACGVARHAYNWALAEWNRQYEAGEKPNEANLRKQYNAIKPVEFPWALEVTKCAPQQAIKNAGTAYKNFFDRLKKGKKGRDAGYPQFKKKGIRDSFRADNGPATKGANAVPTDGKKIKLPINWLDSYARGSPFLWLHPINHGQPYGGWLVYLRAGRNAGRSSSQNEQWRGWHRPWPEDICHAIDG